MDQRELEIIWNQLMIMRASLESLMMQLAPHVGQDAYEVSEEEDCPHPEKARVSTTGFGREESFYCNACDRQIAVQRGDA